MKKYFILFIVIFFASALVPRAYAQSYRTDSGTVTTIVGDGGGGNILPWTIKINNALELGFNGGYNKMVTVITNGNYTAPQSPGTSADRYWCTYSVIDSYNLAGFAGLSRAHAGVVNMISFWKTNSAYSYIDYYNNHQVLAQVKPGYGVFFQDNPGQTSIGEFDHAAIVKDINVDSHGNASDFNTYDSNTPWKTIHYTIENWVIKGTLKDQCTSPGVCHPNYQVVGFGTTK